MNLDSAFRVNSLNIQGKIGVFSDDADPRTIDTSSFPVGSVCFQTNGSIWSRVGPAQDDWEEFSPAEASNFKLCLGLAMGSDGLGHALKLFGQNHHELMVRDSEVVDLLKTLVNGVKLTNLHLASISGEEYGDN